MPKPIEQVVRELADREEIKELTARYCWHVARGEGGAVVDLFTDDGVLAFGGDSPREVRGRPALEEFYRRSVHRPEDAVPFIHNHIIELNGESAQGTCTIDARFIQNGESVIAAGWYADKYRRVEGKWRFAERRITFHHVVPLTKGWAAFRAEQKAR